MRLEEDMDMILIMIPFEKGDVIGRSNLDEDIFCILRNRIVKYFSSVFYDEDKMVIQCEC